RSLLPFHPYDSRNRERRWPREESPDVGHPRTPRLAATRWGRATHQQATSDAYKDLLKRKPSLVHSWATVSWCRRLACCSRQQASRLHHGPALRDQLVGHEGDAPAVRGPARNVDRPLAA